MTARVTTPNMTIDPNGITIDNLNIIEALDRVQEEAFKSNLTSDFWDNCSVEIEYLCRRLELNSNQVILIAVMCEIGEAVSWRRIGDFIGVSRLKAMSFTSDLEGLRDKRWVYRCGTRESGGTYEAFRLVHGVIAAFRHNKVFEPEIIEGLSENIFFDRLRRYYCNEALNNYIPAEENRRYILQLVDANPHLPICKRVISLTEECSKIILLAMVAHYCVFSDSDSAGMQLHEINVWFDSGMETDMMLEELQKGNHELFNCGIIKHAFEDGMIDTARYELTEQAKQELFVNYTVSPVIKKIVNPGNSIIRNSSSIIEKTMFYDSTARNQIEMLKSIFSTKDLQNVQIRLKECGLRSGITCLFYGAPGTGKTESVLQLARECGRDIMQINIAGIRDKYVGESEKNIKEIFDSYRELCKNSENTPILLFNEADAILNRRFESANSSVEKLDNAIQNIILQEMEDLDGILIATTNLAGSLDKALERRFLFKVEFLKPDANARKSIWHTMLPDISDNDCFTLADKFDFSGGQIENIARKAKIDYVISGELPAISKIMEFCKEEHLNRDSRKKVGF